MIHYSIAQSPQDLWQILDLQAQNLPHCVDDADKKSQGFVTVQHEIDLLSDMNAKYQHIVAKADEQVVGFALVMLKEFSDKIPVLVPMFDLIDTLDFKGVSITEHSYFVMGQICIDRAYRGQGVFTGLYHELRSRMQPHFDLVVTEIATRNARSLRAHEKVGFRSLKRYVADGEEWDIVVWDWK